MKNDILVLTFFLHTLLLWVAEGDAQRKNVLFIAADDLRVQLGCYGQAEVKSPRIDRLASQGTLFAHAYCQQTICNPSRSSVMTGLRPDTIRIWDLPTHFRQHVPDVVTLPQLFKNNGYHAQGIGKIFHNWRQDDWKGDALSWSVPAILHYNSHGRDRPVVEGEVPINWVNVDNTECRDVPDNAYYDGRVADHAIEALRRYRETEQTFFLGVGFWKPHLPFNPPKKYWDLYDRESIPLPTNLEPPKNVPELALTRDRLNKTQLAGLKVLHHGHLAAISYLDTQIGRVLDELDALGLRDETIIVFWSDHGLHIGEHGLMRKTTAFEIDAGVPLIIATPDHEPGKRSNAMVELLDLYPTLADLCDLETPKGIEGASLVPLLNDPNGIVKPVALTQAVRPNYLRGKDPESMGYSIRTERFRYTEWREFKTGHVIARELYDHQTDPGENENVIGEKVYGTYIARLRELIEEVAPRK